MVEFIIKKIIIYDSFLIKSIFLVIVNKKPHFKKVHLLIFQFPSPPAWNNWLSHLLYLYSFAYFAFALPYVRMALQA